MLVLTSDDVDLLLAPQLTQLIGKLSEAFVAKGNGQASNIARRRSRVSDAIGYQELAGGSADGGYFGSKIYLGGASKDGVHAIVVVFDTTTGRPRVVIDATTMNIWRTGAATGLATSVLAAKSARAVTLIGTGKQARGQLQSICSVREIKQITLFSRDINHALSFRDAYQSSFDAPMAVASDVGEAVADADVIVTGTTSSVPIAMYDHLKQDVHINAIGANRPGKREIESKVVASCRTIVVDDLPQAMEEADDLIQPVAEGIISWENVLELGQILAQNEEFEPKGRTLFESQGVGLEDVVTAQFAYELAMEQGIGVSIGS